MLEGGDRRHWVATPPRRHRQASRRRSPVSDTATRTVIIFQALNEHLLRDRLVPVEVLPCQPVQQGAEIFGRQVTDMSLRQHKIGTRRTATHMKSRAGSRRNSREAHLIDAPGCLASPGRRHGTASNTGRGFAIATPRPRSVDPPTVVYHWH